MIELKCSKCKSSLVNKGSYVKHINSCILDINTKINIKNDYLVYGLSIRKLALKYNTDKSIFYRYVLLSKLFSLGQEIENTMILPNRKLQERGSAPYYDYMPYFLFECFKGGDFCKYFHYSNEELIDWIKREHLECFFDGAICQENIIDLANTGDLKNGVPTNIDDLLTNYVQILKDRKRYF